MAFEISSQNLSPFPYSANIKADNQRQPDIACAKVITLLVKGLTFNLAKYFKLLFGLEDTEIFSKHQNDLIPIRVAAAYCILLKSQFSH